MSQHATHEMKNMATISAKFPNPATITGWEFVNVYKWGDDSISAHYNLPYADKHYKEQFLDIADDVQDMVNWVLMKHPTAIVISVNHSRV
jgi:hypothetical protein